MTSPFANPVFYPQLAESLQPTFMLSEEALQRKRFVENGLHLHRKSSSTQSMHHLGFEGIFLLISKPFTQTRKPAHVHHPVAGVLMSPRRVLRVRFASNPAFLPPAPAAVVTDE